MAGFMFVFLRLSSVPDNSQITWHLDFRVHSACLALCLELLWKSNESLRHILQHFKLFCRAECQTSRWQIPSVKAAPDRVEIKMRGWLVTGIWPERIQAQCAQYAGSGGGTEQIWLFMFRWSETEYKQRLKRDRLRLGFVKLPRDYS